MRLRNIIRQIAKEQGVTEAEVRREMEEAMRASMASRLPTAKAHWETISPYGKEPKLEAFVSYLANLALRI